MITRILAEIFILHDTFVIFITMVFLWVTSLILSYEEK